MKDMTVLLPAYNEESTIGGVIDEALECGVAPNNIFVGNNNSTDYTARVSKERGVQVIDVVGQGKGYVIHELVKHVTTLFTVVVDSDGTYPLNGSLEVIRSLLDTHDAVLTYRKTIQKGAMSVAHRVGNVGLSFLVSLLYTHYIRDALSGMWGFRTALAWKIHFGQGGFIPDVDFVTGAITNRARICQIPIPYLPRSNGSKTKLQTRDGLVIAKRIIERRFTK